MVLWGQISLSWNITIYYQVHCIQYPCGITLVSVYHLALNLLVRDSFFIVTVLFVSLQSLVRLLCWMCATYPFI
jgi:hypothetical protein